MGGEDFNQLDRTHLLSQEDEQAVKVIRIEKSSCGNYIFVFISWGASLACCVFTAFGSVVELIGKNMLKMPGDTFVSMVKAYPAKTLLSTVIPGVLAVGGIVNLNVLGLDGTKTELKEHRWGDFIGRLFFAIPSGVAMAVLASDINLPFLFGKQPANSIVTNVVRYGAWGVVGLGIGGFLLNNFKSFCNKIASTCKDTPEQKAFDNVIATLTDFYRLEGRTYNMKNLNLRLSNALGTNKNVEEGQEAEDNLQKLLDAFKIIHDTAATLEMPTIRNHWMTNTIINVFSLGASAVGTWSLYGLTKSGMTNIMGDMPESMQKIIAGSGFGANLLLWTISLADFMKNVLNPANYFGDTWSESADHDRVDQDSHDRIARIFCFICTVCFGTMMALIPLVTAEKDADKLLIWAEALSGFLINALIGNLSINYVWKVEYKKIGMSESDKMQSNLSSMKKLFNEYAKKQEQQKSVVDSVHSMFSENKNSPLLLSGFEKPAAPETVGDRISKYTDPQGDKDLEDQINKLLTSNNYV